MRRNPNVDKNQPEIVAALRKAGASVQHLHGVGGGCPDILVGINRANYLVEIKDGSKPPSKRKLNELQQEWHQAWRGQVHVLEDVETAVQWVRSMAVGTGSWSSVGNEAAKIVEAVSEKKNSMGKIS